MNRLSYLIVKGFQKTLHKLFYEPIQKSLFAKHGCDIHIGRGVQGNLQNVSLGNNVSIGANNVFLTSRAKIIIGNDVMFGPGVSIITGDHRTDIVGRSMISVKENEKLPENDKDVVLKGDNWIGANSTILKGVTIGKGAIVAACSLVIHDVEPYTVVGGVPARKIKDRFSMNDLKKHKMLIMKKV